MPARPKGPWFRKGRGYYAFIDGVPYNLKTKDSGEAWEAFYALMGNAGIPVDESGRQPVSVLEIVDRFGLWAQKHRPKSAAWYKQFLDDFTEREAKLAGTDATKLRPFHVQEWIDKHDGWNSTTQNSAASVIKRAYSWAVEQGLLDADPIRSLKKAKRKRRLRILAADEWKAVLEACQNVHIRDLLTVQRETGARPQELRAAEIRHYDAKEKCLRFPAEESKGGVPRVIVLNKDAAAVVRRCVAGRDKGFVFLNTEGSPWTRVGLRMAIRRLVKSSKVHFDAYTLRHTYATDALENEVDGIAVAELMGHLDRSMVANVYGHLDQKPEYLKEAAEKATSRRSASARKAAPKAKKKTAARPASLNHPKKAKRKGRKAQ